MRIEAASRKSTIRVLICLAALAAAPTARAVDPPLYLIDAPFSPEQSSIYLVHPTTGTMTLRATLPSTYGAMLGLAAASESVLYATGTDGLGCFSCYLYRITLDPVSTTPLEVLPIGTVMNGATIVSAVTGMTFRADGTLFATTESDDGLYTIDTTTAAATRIGTVNVDMVGGDITFDADGRLWMWTNTSAAPGLYELDPVTAVATLSLSRSDPRFAGFAALGHTNYLYGTSANRDRVYEIVMPAGFTGVEAALTLGGSGFNHTRGDSDSPYCVDDPWCDDGDACTADACTPGGCRNVAPEGCCTSDAPCADANICTDDTCAFSGPTGTCENTPNTAACDDGNACTTGDACASGSCQSGPPVATGTPCSDGDACNGEETCDGAGGCQAGTPPSCNDDNPCTLDACDPVGGCTFTSLPIGTSCSDGDACNGEETCDAAGSCQAGTPLACDDGSACTTDACDAVNGCVFTPVTDGTSCSDGDVCNGEERCDGTGSCQAGIPLTCNDGSACTTDACDALNGCVFTPVAEGTSCSDGDVCNGGETCDSAGACRAGTALVCDDGNPCTADACDPTRGCGSTFSPLGTPCPDADPCNGVETCDGGGVCVSGTPTVCDDGSACTTDACDALIGCVFTPVAEGTSCSDGDACNGDETCDGAGLCQVGPPPVCDDGNVCTTDACDPAIGCTYSPRPVGTSCSDGDACNGEETCDAGGTCLAGTPLTCADGSACTTDACDPVGGCAFTNLPLGASCSDGDACNGEETCDGAGSCSAGAPLGCDDANLCTADSCAAASGCVHTPINTGQTTCGVGACRRTVDNCVDGVPQTCAPGAPAADDTTCNGIDDDCDGFVDEDGDADGDGIASCYDNCPANPNSDQADGDSDGVGDVCDCAPEDPANAPAAEVGETLMVARSGGAATLTWSGGGLEGPYNVYRGRRTPGRPWNYNQYCIDQGGADTTAEETLVPLPGSVFYYVVTRQGCTESIAGRDSAGNPIPNVDPCPSTQQDADTDGTEEAIDNCPSLSNAGQDDIDVDAVGDACDSDNDNDGTADLDDCAPYDRRIYPGAREICDGIDNDCNAGTLDGTGEPTLGQTCDGPDGDLCAEGTIACAAAVLTCGDTSGDLVEGDLVPGTCRDTVDNDCDGTVDWAETTCSNAATSSWLDFGPASTSPSAGYERDGGTAYDPTRGFGWELSTGAKLQSRSRNCSGVSDTQRTFVYTSTEKTWQLEVSNGEYDVTISVGDCQSAQGPHRAVIEGEVVVGGESTAAGQFITRTRRVRVADGRLSLTIGAGGGDTALNFVDVTPVSIQPATIVSVNFQSVSGLVPRSFAKDTGALFDAVVGRGWNRDLTAQAVSRNVALDRVRDGFVFVESDAARFDVAVPKGTYEVEIAVGDPAAARGPHRVVIEGLTAFDGETTAANQFLTRKRRVMVWDGKLTLEVGGTSGATTLNFVSALAARATDLRVNFQPAASAVPGGYVADSGGAYTIARRYGWDATVGGAVERDLNADQRKDTLILVGSMARTWEAEVPNGDYEVTLAVGDPAAAQGPHRILVEGRTVVADETTAANAFIERTVRVSVRDGRLTLGVGGAATGSTAVDYVDVKSLAELDAINFQPAAAPIPVGYRPDSGQPYLASRGYGWEDSSLVTQTRDRNAIADQAYDTHIYTRVYQSKTWRLDIPDGTYQVMVTVGDSAYPLGAQYVVVEGMLAIDRVHTSPGQFHEASVCVSVADGDVTMTIGGLAYTTDVDWVRVMSAPCGSAP